MTSEEKKERKDFFGKQVVIDELLSSHGLPVSNYLMKMRAYKAEQVLEIHLRGERSEWIKIRSYPFCTFSGKLGPKLKEGDRQIPEGIYKVAVFNPKSKFYLSLGLNYPNERDLRLADPRAPGSDIYIHGGCSSVGCISITDEKIAEVFLLAKRASPDIDVVILPFKSNSENENKYYEAYPQWQSFWVELFAEVSELEDLQ